MCLGINKHSVVCRMVNRHPCRYHTLRHTQYEEQSTIHKYKDLLQNEGLALFHTPNCEGSTSKWMYCMLCHTKIESFTLKYQHCRKQWKYYPFSILILGFATVWKYCTLWHIQGMQRYKILHNLLTVIDSINIHIDEGIPLINIFNNEGYMTSCPIFSSI
jgi:hypothetical protein